MRSNRLCEWRQLIKESRNTAEKQIYIDLSPEIFKTEFLDFNHKFRGHKVNNGLERASTAHRYINNKTTKAGGRFVNYHSPEQAA